MGDREEARVSFLPPDFVMLGVPFRDGVCVYASTELTDAELRAETDFADDPFDPMAHIMRVQKPVSTRYFISATMRTFVMAYGKTYAEALAVLLRTWKPDNPERTSIPAPQRAIEGGS